MWLPDLNIVFLEMVPLKLSRDGVIFSILFAVFQVIRELLPLAITFQ